MTLKTYEKCIIYLAAYMFDVINQNPHDDPKQHKCQVATSWEVRYLQVKQKVIGRQVYKKEKYGT